jgi:hypothetical protein
MKLSLAMGRKSLAVAVALALASGSAQALNAPVISSSAPVTGSLVLGVYDASTGTSETVNLGYTYSQLIPAGAGGPLTPNSAPTAPFASAMVGGQSVLQLDFGTIANWTSFSGDLGNANYFVAANNLNTGMIITNDNNGAAVLAITKSSISTMAGNIGAGIINFQNAGLGGTALSSNTADQFNLNNTSNSFNVTGPGSLGISGTTIAGTVGTDLQLWNVVNPGTKSPNQYTEFTNASGAGFFLLSSTGDLTWNVPLASAVPLPAAAWLLLSGLAGFGAVGRRRRAA